MIGSEIIWKYLLYFPDFLYLYPAFFVDKMSWIILSRFSKEVGWDISDYAMFEIKSDFGTLIPEDYQEVFSDFEYYYDIGFDVLGVDLFESRYKNVEKIEGSFYDVEDFMAAMPSDLVKSGTFRENMEKNYDFSMYDEESGVCINYYLEIIKDYGLIKDNKRVKRLIKDRECPGYFSDGYCDANPILGETFIVGDTLYHLYFTGFYSEECYVCESSICPKYFLELLFLDTLIEEAKEVRDGKL